MKTIVYFLWSLLSYSNALQLLPSTSCLCNLHSVARRNSLTSTTAIGLVATDTVEEKTFLVPIVNRGRMDISVESPYGDLLKSTKAAKSELLSLIQQDVDSLDVHFRLEYIIKFLEYAYTPIQTIPFLNMAISGRWKKLYSNVYTPRAVPELQFEIYQTINCGEGADQPKGKISEEIVWKYSEERESPMAGESPLGFSDRALSERPTITTHSDGVMEVLSNYEINSKGHLLVALDEHVLRANSMPNNVEEFLANLQRTIPFESFDPNLTSQALVYVDPNVRITKVTGDKFLDVYNVYIKDGSSDSSVDKRDSSTADTKAPTESNGPSETLVDNRANPGVSSKSSALVDERKQQPVQSPPADSTTTTTTSTSNSEKDTDENKRGLV
eukprot:CAMPEP_0174998482 /NCGR_PEP_ID=MMETSP0005-20121125/1531_1 /TAXON_ID=420556 /ORGANISM="Ochromonas sp., Strain CCMP1393" /LENGTH=384 /DNA_ID=CAMNT_0016253119 /DNA_START=110 /DNA_END=1264 /DNA_ORIENTATION=+